MISQDRLVQTFLDLVKIDSPSGEEAAMANCLIEKLKQLGATVEKDTFGNVIGKIPGSGETLLLNAHLDTVEPGRGIKPQITGDKITSDGSTILGGDPKAGVAAILEALQSVIEDKKKHVPLEIVLTLGEETGLLGAVNLDYSKVSAKRGVTFDGENGVEDIIVSGPGYNRVDITITGRAAHAGAEPEKGISAIKIAAAIIDKLQVGRIDEETTANIGMIQGGSARNAVPESVVIQGEIRSRQIAKLDQHTQHFQDVFNLVSKQFPDARIDVTIHREFDPYRFSEDHRVIQQIKHVMEKMQMQPHLIDCGGGTDVNIFHTHGIEAICVGNGDYEAHTTREYVLISEMVETAKFCEALVTVE